MRRFRNITSDDLFVGHLNVTVAPDGVVEDPKTDQALEWPESLWAPVAASRKSTKDEE